MDASDTSNNIFATIKSPIFQDFNFHVTRHTLDKAHSPPSRQRHLSMSRKTQETGNRKQINFSHFHLISLISEGRNKTTSLIKLEKQYDWQNSLAWAHSQHSLRLIKHLCHYARAWLCRGTLVTSQRMWFVLMIR